MENKNMVEVDYKLRDIIACALRYTLPRHTYVVEEVCSYIKEHKEILDDRVVGVMLRDVNDTLAWYDEKNYNSYTDSKIWNMDKETIEDLRCFLEDYEVESYQEKNKDAN